MSDNRITTSRAEFSRSSKIDKPDLKRNSIESVLPSYFVEEYPEFVKFLKVYYEFLDAEEGLDSIIERLVDIRNPDIAKDQYSDRLRREYGPGIPEFGTLNDATAMKIFEKWYESKGNKDAMEAYFRIFLNTEAEIVYPKDNILRMSDGNWNEERGEYEDSQGLISESTMVIQDSNYYQIFSYMIRSGVSIADWGPTFRQIAHPAGWALFGEVRLEELAKFEYNSSSPTIVPGFQVRDSNLLILGAALALAVGQFEGSNNHFELKALKQFIRKSWKIYVASDHDHHSLQQANKNILLSTYTVAGLKDYRIDQFDEDVAKSVKWNQQRPARIIIT